MGRLHQEGWGTCRLAYVSVCVTGGDHTRGEGRYMYATCMQSSLLVNPP